MGRLINPGLGEYVDRLTIVALKCASGAEGFDEEHSALARRIETYVLPASTDGHWPRQLTTLAAVNAQIWQAEDQLRAMRAIPTETGTTVAALAFRIQALNDERAACINALNDLGGTPHVEKADPHRTKGDMTP